jgi:hypothetical protein
MAPVKTAQNGGGGSMANGGGGSGNNSNGGGGISGMADHKPARPESAVANGRLPPPPSPASSTPPAGLSTPPVGRLEGLRENRSQAVATPPPDRLVQKVS